MITDLLTPPPAMKKAFKRPAEDLPTPGMGKVFVTLF